MKQRRPRRSARLKLQTGHMMCYKKRTSSRATNIATRCTPTRRRRSGPESARLRPCLNLPSAAAPVLVSAPMDLVEKARIMDGMRINRALARLASEIVEENHGAGHLYLTGIQRRGVPLAPRLADKIADLER